jgi:hypothetical protein
MVTIHQTIARMRDEGYSEEEIQEKVESLEDQKEFDRRAKVEEEVILQMESEEKRKASSARFSPD